MKTVKIIGTRENTSKCDLSDVLPEDVEEKVKEAAEISMGTEISDDDILNIQHLCDQVIDLSQYRAQLYDYLRSRMMAIAPNLTILVGELVGARLISHAGSLNLAKHPASTVQILGAEKALFRALKTKRDTPKYGLIYHAQLVGQASTKNKGKMSRMLAAKASLATRVDALGDDGGFDLWAEHKAKLEARLRVLEDGNVRRISGTGTAKAKFEMYKTKSEYMQYPAAADSTLPRGVKREYAEIEDEKKPLIEEIQGTSVSESPKKKKKKTKSEGEDTSIVTVETETAEQTPKSKKKKKIKEEPKEEPQEEQVEEVQGKFHTFSFCLLSRKVRNSTFEK